MFYVCTQTSDLLQKLAMRNLTLKYVKTISPSRKLQVNCPCNFYLPRRTVCFLGRRFYKHEGSVLRRNLLGFCNLHLELLKHIFFSSMCRRVCTLYSALIHSSWKAFHFVVFLQLEQKVVAENIFKGKKESYPYSVKDLFVDNRLGKSGVRSMSINFNQTQIFQIRTSI